MRKIWQKGVPNANHMDIIRFPQTVLRAEKKTQCVPLNHIQYHDCFELYYLCSGECTYILDSGCYHLQSGGIALIPPGVHHRTTSDHATRIVSYFMEEHLERLCSPALLSQFTCLRAPTVVRFSEEESRRYGALAHAFLAESERRTAAGLFGTEESERMIFLLLDMLYLIENTPRAIPTANAHGEEIGRVLAYIDAHFADIHRMEDMSGALFFSSYHLCHLFKKKLGVSFISYLNMKKVGHAAKLLREGATVTEAGEAVGYSSPSYFSKVFKREMLLSPAQYIKKYRR